MKLRYFKSAADFRAWLEAHGGSTRELWIGFYKKASGKGGLTYKEALDEALCFGWIDGVRKRVDEASFVQRFTPRTASSIWSAVNLKRMKELLASGRVADVGRAVYERRDPKRTQRYSFENRPAAFDAALTRRFKANPEAWTFFRAQPPGYRKVLTFWVMSAKKEETRLRRLDMLIKDSAEGKRITWM
ncbi:MAG TPA: YdeI/OmpD-associated family protein [Vicinamibacterales bacterium]|nr:YdeI/OmpD-associated family protein [Vicinamibacterales bacterium]